MGIWLSMGWAFFGTILFLSDASIGAAYFAIAGYHVWLARSAFKLTIQRVRFWRKPRLRYYLRQGNGDELTATAFLFVANNPYASWKRVINNEAAEWFETVMRSEYDLPYMEVAPNYSFDTDVIRMTIWFRHDRDAVAFRLRHSEEPVE